MPGKTELARGRYKRIECPYCHDFVGNLPNHVRMKHPTENYPGPPKPPPLTKEAILGEKPVEIAQTDIAVQEVPDHHREYACADCHAEVRKGEAACWNCGGVLNWEGIT